MPTLGIDAVQLLGEGEGTKVIPTGYTDGSDVWIEEEHHAAVRGDDIVAWWRGEPGWVRFESWPYTELCVISAGVIEIEDAEGRTRRFVTGDSFVIPEGFSGIWRTVVPSEKIFVGLAPQT